MVKIAIVEDSPSDSKTLIRYVKEYSRSINVEVNISAFDNAVKFLDKYTPEFDIVFMDIEMPYMNGMEASKKLRELDQKVILIFVTNLAKYAIKGYEVQAFDFVVKPITYHDFTLKFRRAVNAIDTSLDKEFSIKTRKGMTRVSVADVTYVEVFGNNLIYHTKNEVLQTQGHLSQIEDTLLNFGFFQCNRCYFVNLRYVTSIKDSFAIVNGEELQISRRRKQEFLSALMEFLGGGK